MILEELSVGQTGMLIFVEQKQEAEKLAKYLVWKLQLRESAIRSLHGYVYYILSIIIVYIYVVISNFAIYNLYKNIK
jgi:hypothetical protein